MASKIRIGAHVSAAGDLFQAPLRAREIGCECFQFFSRPPQGGKGKEIDVRMIKEFKKNSQGLEAYIHSPYYINLASSKNNIYYGSIKVLRDELARGDLLGARYMMAHLGSAKDLGRSKGLKKAIDGLARILKGYKGKTEFLIEMSAGAGEIIGDTFEEIKKIVEDPKLKKYRIGICFDTAHAFASGYGLKNEKEVQNTFKRFDRILGLERLKLIHANDSLADLGSRQDRHGHIGEGKIGLAGFQAIVKFAQKRKLSLILETPDCEKRIRDIGILKKMK